MSNTDLRDAEKAYNKKMLGELSSLWPDVGAIFMTHNMRIH